MFPGKNIFTAKRYIFLGTRPLWTSWLNFKMKITGERSQLLSESIPSSGICVLARRGRDLGGEDEFPREHENVKDVDNIVESDENELEGVQKNISKRRK